MQGQGVLASIRVERSDFAETSNLRIHASNTYPSTPVRRTWSWRYRRSRGAEDWDFQRLCVSTSVWKVSFSDVMSDLLKADVQVRVSPIVRKNV